MGRVKAPGDWIGGNVQGNLEDAVESPGQKGTQHHRHKAAGQGPGPLDPGAVRNQDQHHGEETHQGGSEDLEGETHGNEGDGHSGQSAKQSRPRGVLPQPVAHEGTADFH